MVIDIYASVEFGCVTIGDKNCVCVSNVQTGCEIETQIPIVNMTRHTINYYIKIYDQQARTKTKSTILLPSEYSEEYEFELTEETASNYTSKLYKNTNNNTDEFMQKHESKERNIRYNYETLDDRSSMTSNFSSIESIESTQSVNEFKNQSSDEIMKQTSHIFKFKKPTGELRPNEKHYLNLLFCPLENTLYKINAKCYLTCNDFPEIVCILPVVMKGSGCNTCLKVKI